MAQIPAIWPFVIGMREHSSETPQDVVGLGNAIVDVIAHADDAFLARESMVKGAMTLIESDRAEALYARMGPAVEVSGGSAANEVAAGIASKTTATNAAAVRRSRSVRPRKPSGLASNWRAIAASAMPNSIFPPSK